MDSDPTSEIILQNQIVGTPPTQRYNYDPESKQTYDSLYTIHKTHVKLKEAIKKAAKGTESVTEKGRSYLRNGLSYEEFFVGLMYNDEKLLVNESLQFNFVTFVAEPESPPRASLVAGRAFLTDHRIILISAEVHQGLSLKRQRDDGGMKISGYVITGMASDELQFLTIPLTNIHSVELHASVGVLSTNVVEVVRPCWCLALCSCFGLDACVKKWVSTFQSPALATNERILTLGVALPPWGKQYIAKLHVNKEAPLALVKDYIVELTRCAPNVATKSQNTVSIS